LDELQDVYATQFGWNQTAILNRSKAEPSVRANWFMVQDVGVNTLYAVGWAVLGDLASVYNDHAVASLCHGYNNIAEQAMHAHMWKPELGRFVTTYRDRDGSQQFSSVQAVQTLWPLLLRSLAPEQRIALVADVRNPRKFWTPFPFPSVSLSEPTYTARYTVNLMWRGPAWGFTNWFVLEGLAAVGESALVNEAVARWTEAYRVAPGVWEMWNAETGVGYGAEGLGMSSLLIDWLHRTSMLTIHNMPTPPTTAPHRTAAIGSSTAGTLFDDSWWLNATGSNAVIDRLQLRGGSRLESLSVMYADARAAVGSNDSFYLAEHGNPAAQTPLISLGVPRDVAMASVRLCTDGTTVLFAQFTLTNNQTAAAGDSAAAGCTTFVPPVHGAILAGVFGRARAAKMGGIDALGLSWVPM
jgi:hypothetical protein